MTDWSQHLAEIENAADEAALGAVELRLLGRKQGVLTDALKGLGTLPPDDRKAKGAELNEWKKKVEDAIAAKRSTFMAKRDAGLASDLIDPTLPLPERDRGSVHPIARFLRDISDVFVSMGFEVAEGNEVESEEYNFDFLNIPATHPARDSQDTFWIKDIPRTVLRTHTSPVQIHYMRSHEPPLRMICPGKVYRNDYDATHSPMFHQCEGLMIDRDVSLAHMKAVMTDALRALLGADIEFRFRSGFFPFVEPGLEIDMRLTVRQAHGDSAPANDRWLEVAGCGMVHPNVLKHGGVDPETFQGFAFGFGIERLLMIKHGIPDLRSLYENDLRLLKQFA